MLNTSVQNKQTEWNDHDHTDRNFDNMVCRVWSLSFILRHKTEVKKLQNIIYYNCIISHNYSC